MTSTGGAYFGARPWTVEMPYQATKSALTTASFYLSQELLSTGVAVNSVMPGHTRASWFDATARDFVDREHSVYFMRPLVSEHMLPIVMFLAGQGVARPPVTGRLFHVPDWNYDHGYGDYRVWGDHDLPDELERGYELLEAALPQYWRAGLARAPFDAERVAFAGGMDKLALSSSLTAEAAEAAAAAATNERHPPLRRQQEVARWQSNARQARKA